MISDPTLQVLISQYNTLEDGKYYDVESQSSFAFDHMTQVQLLSTDLRTEGEAEEQIESIRCPVLRPRIRTQRPHVRPSLLFPSEQSYTY